MPWHYESAKSVCCLREFSNDKLEQASIGSECKVRSNIFISDDSTPSAFEPSALVCPCALGPGSIKI